MKSETVNPRARLEALLSADLLDLLDAYVAERVDERLASAAADSDAPAWLTVAVAAERLDCTPDAIRMRVKRGRLVSRRQGRRLYVSAASVSELGGVE